MFSFCFSLSALCSMLSAALTIPGAHACPREGVAPSTGKVSPTSGDCHGGILLKDVQNYMK